MQTTEHLSHLPALLKPREAGEAIRRSTRTIRRLISLGHLRAVHVAGGRPLIPRSELERLLREGAS